MSKSLTIFAVCCVLRAQALSKHIIGEFAQPLGTINFPYPIGICINTAISGFGQSAGDFTYSRYSCNCAGDEVTRTSFGSDTECGDENAKETTVYSVGADVGALDSFSCAGEVNYARLKTYQNDDTCCTESAASPTVSTAVTNVCFETKDGDFAMADCASDGSGYQIRYSSSECAYDDATNRDDPDYDYGLACSFFDTVFIDLYYRIDVCVKDGEEIVYNELCGTESSADFYNTTIAPDCFTTTSDVNGTDSSDDFTTTSDSSDDDSSDAKGFAAALGFVLAVTLMAVR